MTLDAFGAGRTLPGMQDVARDVDAAGFDALWIPEGGLPVFSLCSAAALTPVPLTLGTSVAVAFARSPMVTAQAAWMLAAQTGGRFLPGLGTQVRAHVERRFSAPFEHPGPRMREYVLAMRAIFRAFRGEERLAFDGDFYSFSLLPKEWSPGPIDVADPPVYLSAVRPWMCRMIGEVGDGVLVHPLSSLPYIDEVVRPAVAEGAARAGRSMDEISFVCPVMTAVADDEEGRAAQRDLLRYRLAFYGSTPGYGIVFDASGWPGVGDRLRELQRRGDVEAMASLITDDMVDAFAVTSTWDGLADALVERYAGRAQRVVCYSAVERWRTSPEDRERWSAVTARFRERTAAP
jgi:probable F420-dependent oxidoreductase